MKNENLQTGVQSIIGLDGLQILVQSLKNQDYEVIAPTIQEGVIVYGPIDSLEDLPIGWQDDQEAGTYRLKKRQDAALFGYNVGPHSWKKYLDPPEMRLWSAKRIGSRFEVTPEEHPKTKYAFLGIRACEIQAMFIQDKVFMGGGIANPFYKTVRENLILIGVNCGQAAATCFCTSMETGPEIKLGYDLVLTEVLEEDRHEFLIACGSAKGEGILRHVPSKQAKEDDSLKVTEIIEKTAESISRNMDASNVREVLMKNYEHAHWEEVAEKCLSCANCTLVCPTCFCSTVEDVTDLQGENAERWKKWDSCFTMDFSYMGGGNVRSSVKSRYRQWLTHKLATWQDQFGTSGCVGCGRCITWCPVGIDLTEEVKSLQVSEKKEIENGKKVS